MKKLKRSRWEEPCPVGACFLLSQIKLKLNDRVFKEQSSDIDWKSKDENDKDHWILNSWFYTLLVSLSDELLVVCKLKFKRAHDIISYHCFVLIGIILIELSLTTWIIVSRSSCGILPQWQM